MVNKNESPHLEKKTLTGERTGTWRVAALSARRSEVLSHATVSWQYLRMRSLVKLRLTVVPYGDERVRIAVILRHRFVHPSYIV